LPHTPNPPPPWGNPDRFAPEPVPGLGAGKNRTGGPRWGGG